jgi:superkiller protein 3
MLLLALALLAQSAEFGAEGLKALEAQEYEQAEQFFAKAAEADAKDYSAWFHLALAQSLLNKDAEAVAGYRKALELKPGLYEAELNLGIVLLRQKKAAEAAPFLQSAAQKKPKEFRPSFYAAEALRRSSQFGQAEPYYRAALEIDPKSPEAEAGLGRCLARQGNLAEGAPHFRKAVELDPAAQDVLLELASLYEARKQYPEAADIYRQFPDNPAARERLGELLLESGKAADAIPQLEVAVKSSPTNANRVALATAYLRNKQPERGAALLREAVQAEPDNLDLRMMYGRALRDQRVLGAAAREFARVAQARPGFKEAWSELAGVLMILEQYPQALAALEKVKALGGENAAYYYFRALILDHLKQYQPALESYRQFLAMSQNQHPDEEFKARQRVRIIQKELSKR